MAPWRSLANDSGVAPGEEPAPDSPGPRCSRAAKNERHPGFEAARIDLVAGVRVFEKRGVGGEERRVAHGEPFALRVGSAWAVYRIGFGDGYPRASALCEYESTFVGA